MQEALRLDPGSAAAAQGMQDALKGLNQSHA